MVACAQAAPNASEPTATSSPSISPAISSASPTSDPTADLAANEINLRQENRSRAGLVNLGPGAAELGALIDGKESNLLWYGLRSVNADIAGTSSRTPTILLADLPAPGSTIIGPWAMVTEAFQNLLSDGVTNTRSLDDSPLPTGACVAGYGTCSGDPETNTGSGSKTTTRHGCSSSADGCEGPQTENVTIAGNPGVISTQMTLTVAFDGSKVSMDVKIEISGEIHDAKTGAMIFRIESTGSGHADGDACPDASGTAKLHFEFTAKENYFNGADPAGGTVGYGLNQSYAADVTVRVDDNAKMTGIDIAAKAHEDSKGGVKAAGASQSDLFAHSVDSSDRQTFGYDAASGFSSATSSDQTATSIEALHLSVWMDMYTGLPAKAGAKAAENAWRSGMCILVHATPNGGTVDKDSVTSIDVTVKQRYDGTELDKPVGATFSGVASLDPVGQKQPAPATFVYTAGATEGDRGTMTFESVSNRGIGHTGVTFVVGTAPVAFDITIVVQAQSPQGSATLTLSGVVRSDGQGALKTDIGRATGTLLELALPQTDRCRIGAYTGTALIVASVRGDQLWVSALLTDPPRLDAGILEGLAPLSGGTTHQEHAAELAPGDPPPVGAGCYSYATISQTLTVKPVEP